jgi:hypothetical protein
MKNFKGITMLFRSIIICFITLSSAWASIDLKEVEKLLTTTGLKGEIHGASVHSKLFVLTYRSPDNFFENIQLPLTSVDSAIIATLTNLKRHQSFLVKGNFVENKAPIKHINVTSLELIKDYTSEVDNHRHEYKGDLGDLVNLKEFTGRVHATGAEGKMLVMEYKDRIVPVFVTEPASQALVKDLYRGDLVKIRFYVRRSPESPTHISLETQANLGPNEKALEVKDSLISHHGESVTKTGYLIKFPKSPLIKFNIYALLVEDADGSSIQFTVTNLEDMDLFKKAREKMEKIWDENAASVENDRNKLVNRKVLITAKGTYNMIDRGQANPQIIIHDVNDIKFEIK